MNVPVPTMDKSTKLWIVAVVACPAAMVLGLSYPGPEHSIPALTCPQILESAGFAPLPWQTLHDISPEVRPRYLAALNKCDPLELSEAQYADLWTHDHELAGN